ncbi:MAG: TetR family transcriptional regulator C-terminal domain-containing protein [Ruminococcus sp.]|nr:TetR family transcriptional regulator C-terminal domain-containing protein [Ruminococcus sp.]MCM1382723.1 TetR family transcriptional regulator C-terminal domain-containing protein [Muribaculaceae bacterium]MCM1480852.1 TetR family transcriptional regulator C-terminal domain-containing protein [Muribaculaceae bacterium]
MKTESRRVKITKMLLNESFLKFLAVKPLARITVKEICEDADVNRSTYYAHFTDPYDQLKKLEADIMIEMTIYVDSIVTDGLCSNEKQQQIIKAILEYIKSKRHIFQILLEKGGDFNLQRDILTFFGERIFQNESFETIKAVKKAYQYIYASTGSFGLIYYWLSDNDDVIDIDTLAEWIADFNLPFIKK